jgi:ABC-type microcin C transport system permease subunit YejE
VQGVATLLLVFLGTDRAALAVLIPALFIGFFGHVTSIVTFMVTGTSCLPNKEQGLATGLTSLTQQVGSTIGIPVLRSIAATQTMELTGIHLALTVNVAVTLVSVVLIWFGLRLRGDRRTATTATPAPKEADKKRAACRTED